MNVEKGAIKNGKSTETGNTGHTHTDRKQTKQNRVHKTKQMNNSHRKPGVNSGVCE